MIKYISGKEFDERIRELAQQLYNEDGYAGDLYESHQVVRYESAATRKLVNEGLRSLEDV